MSTLVNYLGKSISALLEVPPYSSWEYERTVDDHLPDLQIDYVCEEEGLEIQCDSDGRIRSVFLTSADLIHRELDLPLQSERSDVLASFSTPSKSGGPCESDLLGEYGEWDRYDDRHRSLHIEYCPNSVRIRMVTLMRFDVAARI